MIYDYIIYWTKTSQTLKKEMFIILISEGFAINMIESKD